MWVRCSSTRLLCKAVGVICVVIINIIVRGAITSSNRSMNDVLGSGVNEMVCGGNTSMVTHTVCLVEESIHHHCWGGHYY